MPQPNDLSRSLVALDQNSTIIAVVELSQSSWLVAGVLPGSAWLLCTLARQSQSTYGSTLNQKALTAISRSPRWRPADSRRRQLTLAAGGDRPRLVKLSSNNW